MPWIAVALLDTLHVFKHIQRFTPKGISFFPGRAGNIASTCGRIETEAVAVCHLSPSRPETGQKRSADYRGLAKPDLLELRIFRKRDAAVHPCHKPVKQD